jgi:hypothetical protein
VLYGNLVPRLKREEPGNEVGSMECAACTGYVKDTIGYRYVFT